MTEIINHNQEEDDQLGQEDLDPQMSLVDHLQEFRKRLLIAIVAVVVGSTISYFYAS